MVRANFKGSALLESVEKALNEFEQARIAAPFDKYYRICTAEEIAEVEGVSVEEFEEQEKDSVVYEVVPVLGYAFAKDEYIDQISDASGLIYCYVGPNGKLYYTVSDRVFELELSDLGLGLDESKKSPSKDFKKSNLNEDSGSGKYKIEWIGPEEDSHKASFEAGSLHDALIKVLDKLYFGNLNDAEQLVEPGLTKEQYYEKLGGEDSGYELDDIYTDEEALEKMKDSGEFDEDRVTLFKNETTGDTLIQNSSDEDWMMEASKSDDKSSREAAISYLMSEFKHISREQAEKFVSDLEKTIKDQNRRAHAEQNKEELEKEYKELHGDDWSHWEEFTASKMNEAENTSSVYLDLNDIVSYAEKYISNELKANGGSEVKIFKAQDGQYMITLNKDDNSIKAYCSLGEAE